MHMAAVTQIRYPDTTGRAYYDRKIVGGMKHKSALRALKRRISDAIYARMISDARTRLARDPGGQSGSDSASSAAGSHPEQPALRTSHSQVTSKPTTPRSSRQLPHPKRSPPTT
jgi:hypothetical protein